MSKSYLSVLTIVQIFLGLISGFIYWFIVRPPLSFHSLSFWIMILIILVIPTLISLSPNIDSFPFWLIFILTLLIALFLWIAGFSPFHAKELQSRLNVKETKEFTDIVEDFDIDSIPRIDKSVAENLANRKLGELEEVVSQYDVDSYSTLINYKNRPYRVLPLRYASFMKYWNNKNVGIPGYILVDLITQEAKYVKLEESIKYSPSAAFKHDLNKHIKSAYPKSILGNYNFEIDDDGIPYWIVPEVTYNFGIMGVSTVENVIVVNAVNGKINRYPISEIPNWIDRALDTSIVLEQINDWGELKDGWFNSVIGQKGVKIATDLYNFIIQDNDVYLYTGITSANGSDQSNIGFFLVNMRTGEAKYTSCASVNENSAKKSAQTIYQEKGYVATDPLLLNVEGVPTYFTSLKDDAGLVKVYALVSATDYKKVGYASEQEGMEKAIKNYKLALEGKSFNASNEDVKDTITEDNLQEVSFKVEALNQVVVNGTTSYYVLYKDNVYIVPITSNAKEYINLKVGDNITANATFENNYYLVHNFEISNNKK